MLLRFGAFILGLSMVSAVVWLGFKARDDQFYVLWFGLASAILVPLGFASVGYAFTAGQRKLLEKLSKVPEVERLIQESQEEKIKLLENERSRLLEVVEFEARKQSLTARKGSLEGDAVQLLGELDEIDRELSDLNIKAASSSVSEDLERLRQRLSAKQRGDIVFRIGSTYFTLDRNLWDALPFGSLLIAYFEFTSLLTDKIVGTIRGRRQT